MIEVPEILIVYFELFIYYATRVFIEIVYQIEKNTNKICSKFGSLTQEMYYQNYNVVVIFKKVFDKSVASALFRLLSFMSIC